MKRHNPSTIHAPLARYAHAVEIEAPARLLFVSGQLAIAPDGSVPSSVPGQCDLIFANIDAILGTAGMTRRAIVRISAYLIDRADLAAYMDARDRYVSGEPPASTLLLIQGFSRPECRIEIEVVAAEPTRGGLAAIGR